LRRRVLKIFINYDGGTDIGPSQKLTLRTPSSGGLNNTLRTLQGAITRTKKKDRGHYMIERGRGREGGGWGGDNEKGKFIWKYKVTTLVSVYT